MTRYLLDSNVLIALTVEEHEHHDVAAHWVSEHSNFALCPIVEGALVRVLLRMGEVGATAAAILNDIKTLPGYEFWADDISYTDLPLETLRGHQQVTDTYLAGLAAHHGTRLATFDKALAARLPEQIVLVTDQ